MAEILRDCVKNDPMAKELYESDPSLSTQLFQRADGKWENIEGVIFEKTGDGRFKMVSDPTSKEAHNMQIQSMINTLASMGGTSKEDIASLRKTGLEAADRWSKAAKEKKAEEQREKDLEAEQHRLYEQEQAAKKLETKAKAAKKAKKGRDAPKEHTTSKADKAEKKKKELKETRRKNLKKSRK